MLATNHRPLTHSALFPFMPNPIYHIVHRAANGSAQGVVHQIRYLERAKVEQYLRKLDSKRKNSNCHSRLPYNFSKSYITSKNLILKRPKQKHRKRHKKHKILNRLRRQSTICIMKPSISHNIA